MQLNFCKICEGLRPSQIVDHLPKNLGIGLGHRVQQVDGAGVAFILDGGNRLLRVGLLVHQPVAVGKAPEHAAVAEVLHHL